MRHLGAKLSSLKELPMLIRKFERTVSDRKKKIKNKLFIFIKDNLPDRETFLWETVFLGLYARSDPRKHQLRSLLYRSNPKELVLKTQVPKLFN